MGTQSRISAFPPEKQAQLKALCMTVAEKTRVYFKDPQHRAQFEAWYFQKYGTRYKWKPIDERSFSK